MGSDCINEILRANDRLCTTSETRFKNRGRIGGRVKFWSSGEV